MTGQYVRACVMTAVLGLAACAVGPDYERPKLATPETYRTAVPEPAETGRLWWRGFEDDTLNELVDRALRDNLDIGIAVARLGEAKALARADLSDLFPRVDGFADGSVRRSPSARWQADGGAGAELSFIPDLFGGNRRRLEETRAQALAAGYTLDDVRRLTAAAVADRYVALRRTQARLDLLTTSLDLQRQTLEIVRQRRSAGLAADLDVQRATADLARTRAQRGTLNAERARAENVLAVLLGQPPSDRIAPARTGADTPIPVFDGGPPAGVPADILRRRPDVLAAEADLIAATAAIGAEKADLYPSLSLPGMITADLGSGSMIGQVTALLAASLDIPLFDAGRRRSEVRAAEKRAEAAVLRYRRALITSLSEVENALAAIQGFEDRRSELLRAVEASEQAFNQLNALYREGLATFIDILDAQRTLIGSREAYVEAQADVAAAVIDLYRTLGAPTSDTPDTEQRSLRQARKS